MANRTHLAFLKKCIKNNNIEEWNSWKENKERLEDGKHKYTFDTRGKALNLSGADLSRANLSTADLHGADLSQADLREADLREADLREADLREADLREADLREADLREVDLSGANLFGADLDGATLDEAGRALINKVSSSISKKTQVEALNKKIEELKKQSEQ